MDEWGHDFAIDLETVGAVVTAYAQGHIELPKAAPGARKDQIRYAPAPHTLVARAC